MKEIVTSHQSNIFVKIEGRIFSMRIMELMEK